MRVSFISPLTTPPVHDQDISTWVYLSIINLILCVALRLHAYVSQYNKGAVRVVNKVTYLTQCALIHFLSFSMYVLLYVIFFPL